MCELFLEMYELFCYSQLRRKSWKKTFEIKLLHGFSAFVMCDMIISKIISDQKLTNIGCQKSITTFM